MAERSNATVLKTVVAQATGGSNPSPSATPCAPCAAIGPDRRVASRSPCRGADTVFARCALRPGPLAVQGSAFGLVRGLLCLGTLGDSRRGSNGARCDGRRSPRCISLAVSRCRHCLREMRLAPGAASCAGALRSYRPRSPRCIPLAVSRCRHCLREMRLALGAASCAGLCVWIGQGASLFGDARGLASGKQRCAQLSAPIAALHSARRVAVQTLSSRNAPCARGR
jgi:hypothetical protein